jgi:hypothetical protein
VSDTLGEQYSLCYARYGVNHSGVAEDQVLWDVAPCPTPWVNSTGTFWTVDHADESTTVPSNVGNLTFRRRNFLLNFSTSCI